MTRPANSVIACWPLVSVIGGMWFSVFFLLPGCSGIRPRALRRSGHFFGRAEMMCVVSMVANVATLENQNQ
jgi:hypothetical protein